MKSLVFISLMCVGVVAKGNTAQWSVVGATEEWANYKAFLVETIDSGWKNVSDIENAASKFAEGTSGDIVSIGRGKYGFMEPVSAIGSNVTVDKMSSVSIVVVDPKSSEGYSYIDNVNMSASVYDESVPGTAPDATIMLASEISKQGTFGGHTDPTPEPTSGLLLLLGAAGLALRRRVK